ncbi:MAG: hypothetical protein IPP63_18890 [Chloracidobacterium sp.]|nr:hypothetical protein [Chloracidobacterium sp.]
MPRSKQKPEYLKRYLKVEDTANGYMSGYGDAAQEGFVMALFKRPNGSYLIGFTPTAKAALRIRRGQFFSIIKPGNGPTFRVNRSRITAKKNTFTNCRETVRPFRSLRKTRTAPTGTKAKSSTTLFGKMVSLHYQNSSFDRSK